MYMAGLDQTDSARCLTKFRPGSDARHMRLDCRQSGDVRTERVTQLMQLQCLPPEIALQSISPREIVLPLNAAIAAIDYCATTRFASWVGKDGFSRRMDGSVTVTRRRERRVWRIFRYRKPRISAVGQSRRRHWSGRKIISERRTDCTSVLPLKPMMRRQIHRHLTARSRRSTSLSESQTMTAIHHKTPPFRGRTLIDVVRFKI